MNKKEFSELVSNAANMTPRKLGKILSEIPNLEKMSQSYFSDLMYVVCNHEPQIIFEIENFKKRVEEQLAGRKNYQNLAEIYMEFDLWSNVVAGVLVQEENKSHNLSMAEFFDYARKYDKKVKGEIEACFVRDFGTKLFWADVKKEQNSALN